MRKSLFNTLVLFSCFSFMLSPVLSQESSINSATFPDSAAKLVAPATAVSIQEPAKRPRVLKFYANWCHPCQMMKPIIEKVAKRFRNKVEIVEIDVDVPENRKLMKSYGVTQLPSMIFQTGNGVQFMTSGTLSEEDVSSDMKQIVREYQSGEHHG